MKINIPTDWSGVTVAQFQAIQELIKEGSEDESTLNMAIISILSGWSMDDVEQLSIGSYKSILDKLKFISQPIAGELKKRFELGGQRYEVISDIYSITGGQYITLMHFIKDEESILKNLHNIMALFCVPYVKKWWGWKKGKYVADNHAKVAEEMKQLTMNVVNPLSSFFLAKYLESVESLLESSVTELEKVKTQAEKKLARLKADTVGSPS